MGRLRIFGGVGVVVAQVASAADLPKIVPSPPGPVIPYFDSAGNSLGNSWAGGVGYTGGYLASLKYQGAVAGDVSVKVSALSALFSAYRDLGTWYGVTPYAGTATFKNASRARSARQIALDFR